MGIWAQPSPNPLSSVELAIEQRFPGLARSCTFDADQKLVFLDMPDLTDDDVVKLITELQAEFPTAFVSDPNGNAAAVVAAKV